MFSDKHIRRLSRISKTMQELVTNIGETAKALKASVVPTSKRRSGKELAAFKKTLAAERKRGLPVSELAAKYGVTPSYIYQLPGAAPAKRKGPKTAVARKVPAKRKKAKAATKPTASSGVEAT